jgi:phospholipid/cholesterol/gamma-HCH transport system substrate-binding protein
MKNINSERDSVDTTLRVAPVALGNLSLAYNSKSGSIGSRLGTKGNIADADGFLCSIVQQSDMPKASKDLACSVFAQILQPLEDQANANAKAQPPAKAPTLAGLDPASSSTQARYSGDQTATLPELFGGPQ